MSESSALVTKAKPLSLLLLVFVHGFKGGDDTFGSFPERLTFLCSETWPQTRVESHVYPAYDTRGSLSKAVELFVDYLTIKAAEREAVLAEELKFDGKGDGYRENAYIILLGHSMGGLVIADATRALLRSRPTSAPSWPRITGVIGYDTPYYGLNPRVFANTATEYYEHARKARDLITGLGVGLGGLGWGAPANSKNKYKGNEEETEASVTKPASPPTALNSSSSGWWKIGMAAAAAAAAGAAAGAAYWQKDRIAENIAWSTSHLDFVGELWKSEALMTRVKDLLAAGEDIQFHCFYTSIPSTTSETSDDRLFIIPPQGHHPEATKYFSPNKNSRASNEIDAHTSMFMEASAGYWALGDASARLISQWLTDAHRRRLASKPLPTNSKIRVPGSEGKEYGGKAEGYFEKGDH